MKSTFLMFIGLLSTIISEGQIRNSKTETIQVFGNCGMCKTAVENAGTKKKLYQTEWNEATKAAAITYDSKKTDVDAVLKSIALAGYDNTKYLAPDEAYAKLPACCKYERKNKAAANTIPEQKNEDMASKSSHTGHNDNNVANEKEQSDQLKAVFNNYFGLNDALVKTDGPTASVMATAMLAALSAVEMEKLKMEEHEVWMRVEKDLKRDAREIKDSKGAEQQRERFMALSKNIYDLIKASKPAGTFYYQFCPMANDGKGANWLSKEKAIKNPYYGSQMLTCGKTVETIKQ